MTTPIDEEISAFFDDETQGIDKERLLGTLCHDSEIKDRWSRYQLINDSLSRNLPPAVDPNFSTSIMQALESEPAFLSSEKVFPEKVSPETVVALAATGKKEANRHGLPLISGVLANLHTSTGKRVAGFAVAATVAAVSVLSFQYNYQQQTGVPSGLASTTVNSNSNVAALNNRSRVANTQPLSSPARPDMAANSASVVNSRSMTGLTQNRNGIRTFTSSMTPSMTVAQSPVTMKSRGSLDMSNPSINAQLHKYLINHSQNVSASQLQGVMPYARIVAGTAPSTQKNLQRQ